jgi:coenzyme PQQ precursor peptide PqqA
MWKNRDKTGVCAEKCAEICVMPKFNQGLAALFCKRGLIRPWGWAILIENISRSNRTAGGFMEWTAPAFEEVCLNCEINSYASAKL